jgi:hypothetical protein
MPGRSVLALQAPPKVAGRPTMRGYSRVALENVLGLIGMVIFIVATIAAAAAVTWLVVKITPSAPRKKPTPASE